ncbi:uncharacterized protein [Miscanthus floridulus]|uniref:uncharacterized protein isoform X4 n=1 Tax=Miscanthus floridulus TaxID=154761 RepID=UPI003457C3AF
MATPLVAGAGGAQPRGGAAGEGAAGDRRGGRRGWLGDDPPRPSPRFLSVHRCPRLDYFALLDKRCYVVLSWIAVRCSSRSSVLDSCLLSGSSACIAVLGWVISLC